MLLILLSHSVKPQTPAKWASYKGRGEVYLNPVDFYRLKHYEGFPELAGLNSDVFKLNGVMADYLSRVGVPILLGHHSEQETYFDLYSSTIARSPISAEAKFGPNKTSGVGNLYLLQHDTAHHFAGIPGMRLSDLKDPVATKKKLINIMLWKEVFATIISSAYYIPAYWEWREKPSQNIIDEFRQHNQGYYSGLAPMTKAEHLKMLEYYIFGKTIKYAKFLKEKMTYESLQKTKELKAPKIMPDLSHILGTKTDSYLMSKFIPYLESVHSYFREVGHLGFMAYSKNQAELLMQPWYVQWSDDFKIGIELDTLHQRTEHLFDQIRNEQELTNPPMGNNNHLSSWENNFLKNEISLFGKRLIEMSESIENPKHIEAILSHYQETLSIYNDFLKTEDHKKATRLFKNLINLVENDLPIEELLPWSDRLPGASYESFWRNPYAVSWNGNRNLKNAFLPRLSSGYLQKMYKNKKYKIQTDKTGYIQNQLLKKYEADLNEGFISQPKDSGGIEEITNDSIINEAHITRFTESYSYFIDNIFKPQLQDFYLLPAQKNQLESTIQFAKMRMKSLLSEKSLTSKQKFNLLIQIDQLTKEIFLFTKQQQITKKVTLTNKFESHLQKAITNFILFCDEPISEKTPTKYYFEYTSPPIGTMETGYIVNIINIEESPVKVAYTKPYKSIATWLTNTKIMDCNKLYLESHPNE